MLLKYETASSINQSKIHASDDDRFGRMRAQLILRLHAGINVVIGDSVRIRSILSCDINI